MKPVKATNPATAGKFERGGGRGGTFMATLPGRIEKILRTSKGTKVGFLCAHCV